MFSTKTIRSLQTFLLLAAVLVPGIAFAQDMEYYTYGGFSDVVNAFTKVALIVSDGGFKTIVGAVFCASLLWKFTMSVINREMGKAGISEKEVSVSKEGPVLSSIINTVLAAAVFLGTIIPTSALHIYDPTENKYQKVDGIPVLIVWIAGGTSLLERALVEMIDTAGSPLSFSKQGGAKGVVVLQDLLLEGGAAPKSDPTLVPSVQKYVADCVGFAVSLGNPTLEDLMSGGSTIQSVFAKPEVASSSNMTTLYMTAAPGGVTATCSDAWLSISTRLDAAAAGASWSGTGFYPTLKQACAHAGYDMAKIDSVDAANAVNAFNQCKANADALITSSMVSGWDLNTYLKESFLINNLWVSFAGEYPSLMADRVKTSDYTSKLFEYLRDMSARRGVLMAVGVVFLPIAALFLVGGWWLSIPRWFFSFFMFFVIWGALIAGISDFWLNNCVTSFSGFFGAWGPSAFDLLGNDYADKMRWWSYYMLASFSVAMAIAQKMGGMVGAAVAVGNALATHAEGAVDKGRIGVGAQATGSVMTPEKAAKETSAFASGYGLAAGMANWDQGKFSAHQVLSSVGEARGHQQMFDSGLTAEAAQGGVISTGTSNAAAGRAIGAMGGVNQAADIKSFGNEVDMRNMAARMQSSGGSAITESQWNSAGMKAEREVFGTAANYQAFKTAQQGKEAGQVAGELKAYSDAQQAGYKGDWQSFNALRSEVNASKDFTSSDRFKSVAAANNMSVGDLARVTSAAVVGMETSKALTHGGGPGQGGTRGMSGGEARNLYNDLSSVKPGDQASVQKQLASIAQKYSIAGGAATVQGLYENLQNTPAGEAREKAFVAAAQNGAARVDIADKAGAITGKIGAVVAQTSEGAADGTIRAAESSGQTIVDQASNIAFNDLAQKNAAIAAREKFSDMVMGGHDDKKMQMVYDAEKGQMSMVLTAESAAYMNAQAKAHGSKAQFKEGQSVNFAMNKDGSVSFATASGGLHTATKNGWTKQTLANTEVNSELVKRSGTDIKTGNKEYNADTRVMDNAPAMNIGGVQYQAGGQLVTKGSNFSFEGKTIGSDELRTINGVISKDAKGNTVYSPISSDGKGGTAFSDNVVSKEIIDGKTNQLEIAMRGDSTVKSAYAQALGQELQRTVAAKVQDSAGAKESVYTSVEGNLGVQTPVGGAKAAAGARLSADYQQQRSVDVKAFEARVMSAMESGKSSVEVAKEIKALRSDYINKGQTALRHQGVKPSAPPMQRRPQPSDMV